MIWTNNLTFNVGRIPVTVRKEHFSFVCFVDLVFSVRKRTKKNVAAEKFRINSKVNNLLFKLENGKVISVVERNIKNLCKTFLSV